MPTCSRPNVAHKTVFLITDKYKFRDFYNLAIAKLVSAYALRYKPTEVERQIKVGKVSTTLTLIITLN